MQTTLHHVRLPGGLTIECAEQGRRGGPALLLLHGITDTWRSFEPVLPWLPPDWHVVSMTQRGHGGSSAVTSYRTRDFADDAASLVATLGLPPVLVVGHSMGAVNALRMAIDHPGAVRGVVAAGGFASFSDKPGLVDFIHSQVLTLGEQVPRELAESFQRDTLAGPVAPGLLETMVDEVCARRRPPGAAPSPRCWRTTSAPSCTPSRRPYCCPGVAPMPSRPSRISSDWSGNYRGRHVRSTPAWGMRCTGSSHAASRPT